MAKKNTSQGIVIALVIIVLVLVGLYATGTFTVVDTTGDCDVVPFVDENGNQIDSYDELRAISGLDVSDEELQQAGVIERFDGLFEEVCSEVIEQ